MSSWQGGRGEMVLQGFCTLSVTSKNEYASSRARRQGKARRNTMQIPIKTRKMTKVYKPTAIRRWRSKVLKKHSTRWVRRFWKLTSHCASRVINQAFDIEKFSLLFWEKCKIAREIVQHIRNPTCASLHAHVCRGHPGCVWHQWRHVHWRTG